MDPYTFSQVPTIEGVSSCFRDFLRDFPMLIPAASNGVFFDTLRNLQVAENTAAMGQWNLFVH